MLQYNYMNSSVMPDKHLKEEKFRVHLFTSRAIKALHELAKGPSYFMVAIGFKLPHISLRVPYRYYEMYKNRTDGWRLTKKESRFPYSAPTVSYRCCGEPRFQFMADEGQTKSRKSVSPFPDLNLVFSGFS